VLARLRSDAPHHAGGRRRSGALLPPPDIAHVLRLQRTIGNRATTRLLRQPNATEEEVRADVEHDRARFDEYKRTHQQRLAEYAERAKPHALKRAGITTDSRVNDDTPKWIQAALAESQLLRPYLRDKFPASAITDGRFNIESDEDQFNQAAKSYLGNKDLMNEAQRAAAFGKIGGYYDRKDRTVHVRSRTKFGHALHEAMHKVAHPVFHPYWDRLINEGVTQFFTDFLLKEQGLSEVTDHEYKTELECANKLVRATSWQVVAAAYFQNDGALRETLMKRFKLDGGQFTREIGAERICSRLP
jgi:hypothetical protein